MIVYERWWYKVGVSLEDMIMCYEKVLEGDDIIVGTKERVKGLKKGRVKEVMIVEDVDFYVTLIVLKTVE
ncbi:hypothetical protein [Priestia megaterium]|uniref:hypothetical protein n=1 Tax=Priestia megaterium TaxID=1404 RepID=UPI001F3CE966|nr:hypothetical protein [Priestia megaterium]